MNLAEIAAVIEDIRFPGYDFVVQTHAEAFHLQAQFVARDIYTGEESIQHTRKWIISPHATRSEVVQTALKCVLTSVEHEARENFHYKGEPIFGPHYDVEALHTLAECGGFDVRNPQTKTEQP